jgi:hypothetical protein
MATTFTAYAHTWKLLNYYGLDLSTATLKVRLVTSGYTFSSAHTAWDNGANNATDPSYNEVADGDGYTTGGITLTSPSADNDSIDFADVTWTTLTKTFRGAILVAIGTIGGVVDPVLGYLLPNDAPADVTATAENYTIAWHATNGLVARP